MTLFGKDPFFKRLDIKRQQDRRRSNFERWRNIIIAKVFSLDGSVDVENKPDYVWIHEWGLDESPAQALRGGINVSDGMPVLVSKDPKEPHHWKIIGIYTGGLLPNTDHSLGKYAVGYHATNHQMPAEDNVGPDPVRVWMPAFAPLKSEGNGTDLTITVWGEIPYWYDGAPQLAPGNLVDLTASIPAAGNTRYVLVYLDMTDGTIGTADGLEVVIGNTPTPPALPTNAIPSSLVQLSDGQTAVTTATHITDARNLYGSAQSDYSDIVVDDTTGNVVTDDVLGEVVWE
jgi:hypothetical protein